MYRHLFSFTLPVELCSGRPNCGATQSFGEKLTHLRPKLIPSKLKCKAKAKSKVKIGAGLQSVACFFRPANGSRSDG